MKWKGEECVVKDKIKEEYKAIDDYYEKREMNQDEFSKKLQYTLDKMDALKSVDDEYKTEVNLLNIIQAAEDHKKVQSEKKEFVMFIVTALIILSIASVIIIFGNPSIIMYGEIVIAISLPLCLIPICLISLNRSEKNE